MKTFKNMGTLIRTARQFRCKTQAELANEVGITKSFVSHIESGKFQLPIQHHLQVAKYLKIEPIELQSEYVNDCIDNYQRSLKC